jgi:ribosomal-protein-alanine N-acetyltransferase
MLDLQLLPFRPLQTSRLSLRELTAADAADLLFLRSDEEVMRHIHREKDTSLAQVHNHLRLLNGLLEKNEGITWGMALPPQPGLVGIICLWQFEPENYRAEVGYALHPAYWGQGLMSEALTAVLRFSFEELQLHSITAHVSPENTASVRLLEKHGFVLEGHLRENYCFRSQFLDTLIFSRLAPPLENDW